MGAWANWSGSSRRLISTIAFMVLTVPSLGMQKAAAQEEAIAASGPPVSIALLVNSNMRRCYDSGSVAAIRRLAGLEEDKINSRGGIGGRRLELIVLDGKQDDEQTIENVRTALETQDLLAIVGLSNASRGEKVFAALGEQIRSTGVPFISHISVSEVFADLPNVFSSRPSQESERVPVMAAFAAEMGFRRVAFLANGGTTVMEAIGDGLKESPIANRMIGDYRLQRTGQGLAARLDEPGLNAAIADMKAKRIDFIVMAAGTSASVDAMEKLKAARFTPAIMLLGNLSQLSERLPSGYPNAIYQLDWDAIPEVEQDSVRNVVTRSNPEDWLFEGAKIADAPGWADGTCDADYEPEPFSRTNLNAIASGAQYADMVALVAEAANRTQRGAELAVIHKAVLRALGETYAAGRGAFKGRVENWSFFPDVRTRSQSPFIIILPQQLGRTQLAPVQFVRTREGTLRRIDTLYLDIDLLRAYGIDNDARAFHADFYLSMRASDRITLGDIKFTNAFIDPRTNGPHLAIETIYAGGASDAYPQSMHIYRISGRFRFNPDFGNYPFDSQQFSIDIQPRSGDKQFIIQPPPLELRDTALSVDNWDVENQYVSYAHEFVPVVDSFTHEPSITPFYQTRYVWQMKREATDYYLRVLVPLAFILTVAYLSIFIPASHIEAIITLQVTALLAAVALYLSLPQVDSDTATVSDRLFVLDYMMVSLMILISILRINVRGRSWRLINNGLVMLHVVVIPLLVIVTVALLLRALPVGAATEIASWDNWLTILGFGG